jgi:hypothetical protein
MAHNSFDTSPFDNIPRLNPKTFEPPAWASGPAFQWLNEGDKNKDKPEKNGESSTSPLASASGSNDYSDEKGDDDDDDGGELWEDASEGLGVDPVTETFTTVELKVSPDPIVLTSETSQSRPRAQVVGQFGIHLETPQHSSGYRSVQGSTRPPPVLSSKRGGWSDCRSRNERWRRNTRSDGRRSRGYRGGEDTGWSGGG